MEGSTNSFPSLPAAVLDHIACYLDATDRRMLSIAHSCGRQAVQRTTQAIIINASNADTVNARDWITTSTGLRNVRLISSAQQLPACLQAFRALASLTSLTSISLVGYCRAATDTTAWEQSMAMLAASLPVCQDLQYLNLSAHVETGTAVDGRLTNSICSVLGAAHSSMSIGVTCQPCGIQLSRLLQMPHNSLLCITKLIGLRVDMSQDITGLSELTSMVHLHMTCLYPMNIRDAEMLSSAALGSVLSSMQHLTQLHVADFQGNVDDFLLDMAALPYLSSLSLPGPITCGPTQLALLAALPALTQLSVDWLHLDRNTPTMPHLIELEAALLIHGMLYNEAACVLPLHETIQVGMSISGIERCPCVFPWLQQTQFSWLWEGALLKLAGCQHLTSLTLSQLSYGTDWRLLRTLPVLSELKLCHGHCTNLLCTLLETLSDISGLKSLSLLHWSSTKQPLALTQAFRGMGTGIQHGDDSNVTQNDVQLLADCLMKLPALHHLEITNCFKAVVVAVASAVTSQTEGVGSCGLKCLQQLRITQLPYLEADSDLLQQLVSSLDSLRCLELGALGSSLAGSSQQHRWVRFPSHVDVSWDEDEEAAFSCTNNH